MKPWKTLSRKTVYEPNRFLSVERHAVELPDGRVIEDWAWIKVPEYAIILARTTEGKFLCFRQVKYAVPSQVCLPIVLCEVGCPRPRFVRCIKRTTS